MKLALTTLLFCFSIFLFGQEIIPEAARNPEINASGDPVTNIIDPDGARQGEWFYDDYTGKAFLKEVYLNNGRQAVFLADESNGEVSWIDSETWSYQAIGDIENKNPAKEFSTLKYDQQVAIILDPDGKILRIAYLGNWTNENVNAVQAEIESHFETTTHTFDHVTVILL